MNKPPTRAWHGITEDWLGVRVQTVICAPGVPRFSIFSSGVVAEMLGALLSTKGELLGLWLHHSGFRQLEGFDCATAAAQLLRFVLTYQGNTSVVQQ